MENNDVQVEEVHNKEKKEEKKEIPPVNVYDFQAIARKNLSKMAYDYYASGIIFCTFILGANDQITLKRTRKAYNKIQLFQRFLKIFKLISKEPSLMYRM
jgi:hypothetical protein